MTRRTAPFVVAVLATKIVAAYFLLVSALGFLWFPGSHDGMTIAYFVATLMALTAFAVYPRRALVSSQFRRVLVVAAAIALLTTVFQMYGDITHVNGANYGAFWMRALECAIFVVTGLEVFAWPRLRVAV